MPPIIYDAQRGDFVLTILKIFPLPFGEKVRVRGHVKGWIWGHV
jgi:hypothetical protein